MALFSPQTDYFKVAANLKKAASISFFIIFSLSLLFTFFNSNTLINTLSILALILIFLFDIFIEYYREKGELNRRKDFIDNSFGTKLSINSSILYYDNEEICDGLYKALVNVFENSFFSLKITNKMKNQALCKNIIMLVLVVICAFYGFSNSSLALPILQLFLSKYFIEDILTLFKYNSKVEYIFQDIVRLFSNGLSKRTLTTNLTQATVIHILIEYEANIANSKLFLDTKIFNKLNSSLTNEWIKIKEKYSIV